MIKWIKRNWIVMVILLILIIVGPLAINWLFKQKAPIEVLVAEWDASAALGYYGAVIGAAIAYAMQLMSYVTAVFLQRTISTLFL